MEDQAAIAILRRLRASSTVKPQAKIKLQPSTLRERRKLHDLSSRESRFMSAEPHTGPIGGLHGIGVRIAILPQRRHEFVS